MMDMQTLIRQKAKLAEALKEARDWNNSDIRCFDDIQPDMNMLKNRRKVINAALRELRAD